MDYLEKLENNSIYLLREAYANFKDIAMLWSVGKDSTVLLWLAKKAFFGYIPFPLIHIDTGYKHPEMISYRDKLTCDWKLDMIYGINNEAIKNGKTFESGNINRMDCCRALKTEVLKNVLNGNGQRYRYNHGTHEYEKMTSAERFSGIILGIRSDEEGSRSKERYFSSRDDHNYWNVNDQPPEFWNQYNVECRSGSSVRIHPLLDWSEVDIWSYISQEKIPVVSLYYDHGIGKRYRSLGCWPCTEPIDSEAKNPEEVIDELTIGKLTMVSERSGRGQDQEDNGGLETLRKEGYM